MTLRTLVLTIIFSNLGFYSRTTNVLGAESTCVRTPATLGVCNFNSNWNVSNATLFRQHDKLTQINVTLAGIATAASVKSECVVAIRRVLCVQAFPKCNETNTTALAPSVEDCQAVTTNCSALVAKTYCSASCPSITSYNNMECVDVKVNSGGYCPDTATYKVLAKDVSTFLERANREKEMFQVSSSPCPDIYKIINCISFVPSNCSNFNNITKENCEQQLTKCLTSNSALNKTELCLKFPRNITEPHAVTLASTATPTIDRSGFPYQSITMTFRLNIKYNADYTKKASASYKKLVVNITDALNKVYKSIPGFERIAILALTCEQVVAVKHNVTVRSRVEVNTTVIAAKLDIANKVHNGFLENKITDKNKPCVHEDHKHGDNWVYMILFVCITALLLLAMVLCNQQS